MADTWANVRLTMEYFEWQIWLLWKVVEFQPQQALIISLIEFWISIHW